MSRSFLTNINLNKNELQNAAIQALSTAPSNPTLGQIYYDTNEANLRQWDGTQWLSYVTSDGSGQFIHSVGDNLVVTDGDLTLGSKVVIDDASQSLTNKTLGSGNALSADLDADGNTIINLPTPVNPGDAANKGYVDATAQGLSVLGSVRTATSANITDFAAVGPGATISGVALLEGDRVLVKAQDDATENGIYIYNNATFALVPSTSPSDIAIKDGSYVLVEEGTYGTQGWIVTAFSAGASTWTQFSAAGEYVAGTGIGIVGNTIEVTTVPVANGGTGANGAVDARANLGATTKVSVSNPELISTGGAVSWLINHELGYTDVTVQLRSTITNQLVEVDVELTDLDNVTLSWVSASDVAAGTYRAVIVG